MKLSDAIEQGWRTVPRIIGRYQEYFDGRISGACAIGAACYAVNPKLQIDSSAMTHDLFPQLDNLVRVDHPTGNPVTMTLADLIVELNDQKEQPLGKEQIIGAIRNLGY